MDLLFTEGWKVEILMEDQCQEAIDACGEDVSTPVTTPAQSHLFDVDENDERIDERKSKLFHSITAKLLFIKQWAKPDIDTAVAFLCTRVSKSGKQDWNKLKRVLQFVNCTKHEPRIIGAGRLDELWRETKMPVTCQIILILLLKIESRRNPTKMF